jgi:hypothetical protein
MIISTLRGFVILGVKIHCISNFFLNFCINATLSMLRKHCIIVMETSFLNLLLISMFLTLFNVKILTLKILKFHRLIFEIENKHHTNISLRSFQRYIIHLK